MSMLYTNHLVYKLSSQTNQLCYRGCVYMLYWSHSVHTWDFATQLHTTRRRKLFPPCWKITRRVWRVGAFTWFSKKWFFASFQHLWCVTHKKVKYSGRLLIVQVLMSAHTIPLALRVNFALGVDFYVKCHVESKNRCCQVWIFHHHA